MRYIHQTRIGLAQIVRIQGRWGIFIDDENLGSYNSPAQALDDLVGGHTFSHSSGVDTSTLNLPEDLGEWEQRR